MKNGRNVIIFICCFVENVLNHITLCSSLKPGPKFPLVLDLFYVMELFTSGIIYVFAVSY